MRRWRAVLPWVAGWWLAAAQAQPQPQPLQPLAHASATHSGSAAAAPQPLSYAQAWQWLQQRSDRLAAAAREVEGAQLRRQAMQDLGGPTLALTGMAYHYSAHADISLDPARQALSNITSLLPPPLGSIVGHVPQLPDSLSLQRQASRGAAHVSLIWPLYTGGLSDAVRSELDALADEAQADASSSAQGQLSLLAQRYFGAQLAERAAQLRLQALEAVRQHADAAARMQRAGVISELEHLQARAALADAGQQARKAQDEARLSASALARTLKAEAALLPTSPLFVDSRPLPALDGFIDAAWQQHPGLAKVNAKRRQASALHEAQEALRRPQLLGFGMRELALQGRPNWVAGVALRYTLWDSVDRDQLAAAGQRKIEQAELTERQIRQDIALLVEKNWLAVEQARSQYLAQQAQQDLAQELLRLRRAALAGGTGTALELIDAELHLARVHTERAQTAHQYVQALAALLESSGQSSAFERYMAQADIQLSSPTP